MVLAASGTAFATGPIAVAGAAAVSQAVSGSQSGAYAGGGSGTGVGVGGNSDSGGNTSTNSSKDNSTSVGAALGQAPTALSQQGICGKGTKFVFGALEWSDYSSKCFNYQIAIIAAEKGDWELANQWVKRADDM